MSDNKKYYYLKLKENHFEFDEMIVLESMPDGYKYSNILLKLYLRSLKNGGKLMFNERIPFNSTMLATITRHSVGDIEKAVKIFEDLGLVEILDNGAIYMNEIQNFIGKGSTEAERKAIYRAKIDAEKKSLGQCLSNCPDKYPPEIEQETDLDKDLKISLLVSLEEINGVDFKTFKNKLIMFCPNFKFRLPYPNKLQYCEDHKGFIIKNGYIYDYHIDRFLSNDESFLIWDELYNIRERVFVAARAQILEKTAS